MSTQTALTLSRWVIAVLLLVKGALVLANTAGGAHGSDFSALPYLLVAFGFGITGVVLMAPELVPWASAPVWRFISGIIYPDEQFKAPPVNYTLPRSYHQRLRHEEAIEEYQKIIRHHPQEQTAYLECIEVMLHLNDIHGAKKVLAEGLRKLHTQEAKRELREAVGKVDRGGLLQPASNAGARINPPA